MTDLAENEILTATHFEKCLPCSMSRQLVCLDHSAVCFARQMAGWKSAGDRFGEQSISVGWKRAGDDVDGECRRRRESAR